MSDPTLQDYEAYIAANVDKVGTPEYNAVMAEYNRLVGGEGIDFSRMGAEMLGGMVGAGVAIAAGQLGPQVLTPEEIGTVPIATGLGAAAGGRAHDAIESFFFPQGEQTFMEKLSETTIDFLANAIGTRAGELLPDVAKSALSRTGSTLRSTGDEIAKAFRGIGIRPTAGAVGSQTMANVENGLARLPFSDEVIARDFRRVFDGMDEFARKQASNLSTKDGADSVGRTVIRGVDGFVERFNDKARVLYDRIPIRPEKRVSATNFQSQLETVGTDFVSDPQFGFMNPDITSRLRGALAESPDGMISYGALKGLRTRVGNKIDAGRLIGDEAQGDLKLIYGALSEDMAKAAADHSPSAMRAFERANSYWAAGRGRIDDILNPLVRSSIESDVYKAVFRGSKDGARRLRSLRSSLDPGEWDAVVAQTIRDMGRAGAGHGDDTLTEFSADRFVTNYKNFQKSGSLKVLFGGEKYRGLDEAMQNLFKASGSLKEASRMANTSNTSTSLAYMGLLSGTGWGATGSVAGGVAAGATSVGLPWGSAKLITSPAFVNWLARGAATPITPSAMSAHMARLGAIAASDPSMVEPIQDYLQKIVQQTPAVENSRSAQ